MKQLLPKLKKINCEKLISKKKSQIDRARRELFKLTEFAISEIGMQMKIFCTKAVGFVPGSILPLNAYLQQFDKIPSDIIQSIKQGFGAYN